ncbi:MAG: Crp/Fnr family transcriptional regulator, partial [Verrucomicrobiales bacterium]|nr:Crp/Fnr family transcriptional regulator [Verrucomicrobiales bacterium]
MAIYELNSILRFFRPEQISERSIEEGEVLFHQGEEAQSIFFVLRGEVRAETYLADGKTIVFFRAKEGSALTEEMLFLDRYLYTAVATVASTVRMIPKADFLDKFRREPKFSEALLCCLAERYSEALMSRELIGIKSAEDRLLIWLEWRAGIDGRMIDLSGSMGSISAEVGLTR